MCDKSNCNPEVSRFLDGLRHPFRTEIEELRALILGAEKGLVETIKWNAPNYSLYGADRITMKVQPPAKHVQVIFHCGAKSEKRTGNNLITDISGLLSWRGHDRAIATFRSLEEINGRKADLARIVKAWLKAAS